MPWLSQIDAWCRALSYIDAWCTALSHNDAWCTSYNEPWMHSTEPWCTGLSHNFDVWCKLVSQIEPLLMPDAQHWATYWCLIALSHGCTALSHNYACMQPYWVILMLYLQHWAIMMLNALHWAILMPNAQHWTCPEQYSVSLYYQEPMKKRSGQFQYRWSNYPF